MLRVFISCPMNGLSDEEIIKTRTDIKDKLGKTLASDFEIVDSFFTNFHVSGNSHIDPAMYYLGMAICKMANSDVVVFAKGWDKARGCKMEYEIARAYGKTCILL